MVYIIGNWVNNTVKLFTTNSLYIYKILFFVKSNCHSTVGVSVCLSDHYMSNNEFSMYVFL